MALKPAIQAIANAAKNAGNKQIPESERRQRATAAVDDARRIIRQQSAQPHATVQDDGGTQKPGAFGSNNQAPSILNTQNNSAMNKPQSAAINAAGAFNDAGDTTLSAWARVLEDQPVDYNLGGDSANAPYRSPLENLDTYDRVRNAFRTPEQKERDEALLEERERYVPGYERYREEYVNSGGDIRDMMSFNEWSQQEIDNGSWLEASGVDVEGGDQAAIMNAYMNDPNNTEAREYLEANGYIDPETQEGTWDFYNDYAAFAQDGSSYAKNAWSAWYSDPNIAPVYLQQLGDVIDTDGQPGISRAEAEAYWDTMNAYKPESFDYFTDDEMMQRVMGYSDIGPSVYAMDAWNNYLARDQVVTSLLNGTYAEDVEAGLIPVITDASGKDLVEALGLDKAAEEYNSLASMNPESMSDADMDRYNALYDMFINGSGDVARWNNALGAAQYSDYKSENPDSDYEIDWGYYNGVPVALDRIGAASGVYTTDELNQMMLDQNQARGWEARLNNIAGGNSGYTYVAPGTADDVMGDYEQPNAKAQAIADLVGVDYNQRLYYDPTTNMNYYDRVTESGTEDLNALTGTTSISPDLLYLIGDSTGLNERGWEIYGGGVAVPEYHMPASPYNRIYSDDEIARAGDDYNRMLMEQHNLGVQNMSNLYGDYSRRKPEHGGIDWSKSNVAEGVTVYNDGTVIGPTTEPTGHVSAEPSSWYIGA